MDSKHILFLASWYPSRIYPFNGDFIQRHALAAAQLNKVSVLHAIKDDNQNEPYRIEVKEDIIKEVIVYYKNSSIKPLNYLRRMIALNKGLKDIGNYDLIHLNVTYPMGVFALLMKLLKNKRYIVTEHWTGFQKERFEMMNPLKRLTIKQILKNSEMVLPVSKDLGENIFNVYPVRNIQIVPNVVDVNLFKPDNLQSKNTERKIKFLHLSSLKDDQKNINGMLNVAKHLADENFSFEFHIGGTKDLSMIYQFIEENKLQKIIFPVNPMPYNEVGKFMKNFDAFILFSNYETQSCVRLESFSVGLPFIATNIGGVNEFFPNEFGILVEKGNETELFNAMVSVIENKEFANKEKMHQYVVDNFSMASISNKLNEIYQKVIEYEKN